MNWPLPIPQSLPVSSEYSKYFHVTPCSPFSSSLDISKPWLSDCLCEGKQNLRQKFHTIGASLVAQWLRIRLSMQGTGIRALVLEDPICRRATKPACHNYWACTLEPVLCNKRSLRSRACGLQQEKPPQWVACAPQRRVAPAPCS